MKVQQHEFNSIHLGWYSQILPIESNAIHIRLLVMVWKSLNTILLLDIRESWLLLVLTLINFIYDKTTPYVFMFGNKILFSLKKNHRDLNPMSLCVILF